MILNLEQITISVIPALVNMPIVSDFFSSFCKAESPHTEVLMRRISFESTKVIQENYLADLLTYYFQKSLSNLVYHFFRFSLFYFAFTAKAKLICVIKIPLSIIKIAFARVEETKFMFVCSLMKLFCVFLCFQSKSWLLKLKISTFRPI